MRIDRVFAPVGATSRARPRRRLSPAETPAKSAITRRSVYRRKSSAVAKLSELSKPCSHATLSRSRSQDTTKALLCGTREVGGVRADGEGGENSHRAGGRRKNSGTFALASINTRFVGQGHV